MYNRSEVVYLLQHPEAIACLNIKYSKSKFYGTFNEPLKIATVDRERFAGLNIHGFSAIEVFSRKYFNVALAISVHYLVQLKRDDYIHGKAFAVLLKTVKNQKFSPVNLSPFTVHHEMHI